MPDVLVAAAVLSLLFAVLMTVIAAKLLRESRARTSSRVEALQALAAEPATIAPRMPAFSFTPATLPVPSAAQAPTIPMVLPRTAAAPLPDEIADEADEIDATWDFDLRDEYIAQAPVLEPVQAPRTRTSTFDVQSFHEAQPSHDLFEAAIPSTPSRRWSWMAAAGVVMVLGGGTFWVVSSGVIGRAIAVHEANATNANALPIELLSLRYATDTAGFVVTGLVQNPEKSVAQNRVVAVVYLFDAEGKYIASSRAALESAVLSPGGESGFVVHVPAATEVSKYRVSFQHEDGAAVTHVDRRGSLPANTTGDAVSDAAQTGSRASFSGSVVRK